MKLVIRNLKAFTRDNGLFDTLSFYMNDFLYGKLSHCATSIVNITMCTFLHLEGWNNK